MAKVKKFTLPATIQAFTDRVEVRFVPDLVKNTNMLGALSDGHIILEPEVPWSTLADTVIHELFHVIYAEWLRADDNEVSKEEERTVRSLATGLVTIFLQNPEFFLWWVATLQLAIEEKK